MNSNLTQSLFWKFFVGFWVCLIGAALITVSVLWFLRDDAADLELHRGPRAHFLLESTALVLESRGPNAVADLLKRRVDRHGRPMHLLVVSQDGQDLLGRPMPPDLAQWIAQAFTRNGPLGESGAVKAHSPDGRPWILVVTRPPANPLIAEGGAHKPGLRLWPSRLAGPPPGPGTPPPWGLTALPLFVALLASFGFAGFLAWRFSQPFRQLRQGFESVSAGRLDTRIASTTKRRDELGLLLTGFDQMAERLQMQMDQQRALLHDVSHELRSPLARLNMAAGLARQNPNELQSNLDRVELEASKLDELIGQLLHLSRLQSGLPLSTEPLDVLELLANVLEDAQFEAEQLKRTLQVELPAGRWPVDGNADAMHSAFENVIRNGLRYTPTGGTLRVRALEEDVTYVVEVEDEGPGLPAEALDKMFAPFVKAGAQAGHGLGLAIAQKAMAAHQGEIRANNRPLPHHGLLMQLILPKPLANQGTV